MDRMRRPKTHATSVTTREGNKIGVQGLSFWLGVPHSLTCFLQCLRSEFWKHGTFSDLQQFVFNKQWQTTSSPFPLHCSHSPGFYVYSAFEPAPKAATLKQTWPRGSLLPNSGISFLQTSWVATGREYPANISPVNHVPISKSTWKTESFPFLREKCAHVKPCKSLFHLWPLTTKQCLVWGSVC